MSITPDVKSLVDGILQGDRSSLSQGITLVESTLITHHEAAEQLLQATLPKAGSSLRVAITGAPGVGKSTLIESLGIQLVEAGKRIAVLSVDPSSPQTGGSILGDKTRMSQLVKHPNAFIRPSPSGTSTGGITPATRSAMLLCEAAGYDPILIETVGTGQAEYAVRQIVDLVLLLVLAHAGDELQGIKRGILESADLIAVTKADGETKERADSAAKTYRRALSLYSNRSGIPQVHVCSALENTGIAQLWAALSNLESIARENGLFDQQRQEQLRDALLETSKMLLFRNFSQSDLICASIEKIQQQVLDGECTIHQGARQLVGIFRDTQPPNQNEAGVPNLLI